MSTRWLVGYTNEQGKIVEAYVHFDGYPEYATKCIKSVTIGQLIRVINCGDFSSFESDITNIDYYDDGRDISQRIHDNKEQFIDAAKSCGCNWAYLVGNSTDEIEIIKIPLY